MRKAERGSTVIEMTLVGIPIIFTLISVVEISRGMWMYHTLAYAAKNGVRLAIVHGRNCINGADNPNNCPKSISDIATLIQQSAIGPIPQQTRLSFSPGATSAATTQCYLVGSTGKTPCSNYTTAWPPDDGNGTLNGVGKRIEIDIDTPFPTALSMFWPGGKPVSFGVITLGATSADYMVF